MTGREPERTATVPPYVPPGGDRCGTDDGTFTCNAAPGHPGDHAAYGPGGRPLCHAWPQTSLAGPELDRAARLARIRALTPGQCMRALIYMAGYEPQGVDSALAEVAVPAYTAELDGTENFGRANPAGES